MNKYLKKFISEKFKKPGKVLDLGAGDFLDSSCLKKLGWKCEGVDIKTGVDLEKYFVSRNNPFDLVYSNYLLHKIRNKSQFIQTTFDNLKNNGWLFLHALDKTDKNSSSNLSSDYLLKLLSKQGFKNIKIKSLRHYDNKKGHKHWHNILEAIGQKNPVTGN